MRIHTFESEECLPRPQSEVFSFFADAFNLERITPPFLQFRVVTPPPIDLRAGTLIDYRLRIHGVPVHWQSEITVWDPPHRFVDLQLRGPYRLWRHEHSFTASEGGTLCRDVVSYAAPGGLLVNRFLVSPDVQRIFDYRRQRLAHILGDRKSEPSESSRAADWRPWSKDLHPQNRS